MTHSLLNLTDANMFEKVVVEKKTGRIREHTIQDHIHDIRSHVSRYRYDLIAIFAIHDMAWYTPEKMEVFSRNHGPGEFMIVADHCGDDDSNEMIEFKTINVRPLLSLYVTPIYGPLAMAWRESCLSMRDDLRRYPHTLYYDEDIVDGEGWEIALRHIKCLDDPEYV